MHCVEQVSKVLLLGGSKMQGTAKQQRRWWGIRFHCNFPFLFEDTSHDEAQCYKLYSPPFIEDAGCEMSPIPHALYRDTHISSSDGANSKQRTHSRLRPVSSALPTPERIGFWFSSHSQNQHQYAEHKIMGHKSIENGKKWCWMQVQISHSPYCVQTSNLVFRVSTMEHRLRWYACVSVSFWHTR